MNNYKFVYNEEKGDDEYTNFSKVPEDDFRLKPCEKDFTPEQPLWKIEDKRYAKPDVPFLPDEVVTDYNDKRDKAIAELERKVEALRLQQTMNSMTKKERKKHTIQPPTKAEQMRYRLQQKLAKKQQDHDNFVVYDTGTKLEAIQEEEELKLEL